MDFAPEFDHQAELRGVEVGHGVGVPARFIMKDGALVEELVP